MTLRILLLAPLAGRLALAEDVNWSSMVSGERGSPFKKAGILGLAYHLYLILPWEENQFIPIPVSEIAGYER